MTRKRSTPRGGYAGQARFDRLWDKRRSRDPAYLMGQLGANAPVKYSRCTMCVGRPHHPPVFFPTCIAVVRQE